MGNNLIFNIIDWTLFSLCALGVLYLSIYSIASLFPLKRSKATTTSPRKYLVIFPAYKEDNVIIDSVSSFLKQTYPSDSYELVVISDKMRDETNNMLQTLPVKLLIAKFDNSSKAKALQFAIEQTSDSTYDAVIILDADNTVEKDFLYSINEYFNKGEAIQAHRTGKNRNTNTAILDSVSEEINNSIFRKGHVNLGLSSALIGSGMIFDYKWFKENVGKLATSGEDKELEILLLKQRIHISYLDQICVYDEKTQKSSGFYNQRRRWIATQFYSLRRSVLDFFPAIFSGNWDYTDKLIQWMLPPRIVHIGVIFILSIIVSFVTIDAAIKWWILLAVISLTLSLAVPRVLWDKQLLRATLQLPLLFVMMVANFFRVKGADKKFIHTEKNYENSNRSTTDIPKE